LGVSLRGEIRVSGLCLRVWIRVEGLEFWVEG